MSADLKSMLAPAQPTTRETAWVGYALEVGDRTRRDSVG
jgi:hypothetical protein